MMLAPKHLKDIVVPRGDIADKELFIGDVRCRCGSESFKLMYPGQTHQYKGKTYPCTAEMGGNFFFLIKAVCTKCNAEYTLFDKHFHGWDGVMCHDIREASLPRPPLTHWKCLSCGTLFHKVTFKIAFESKENFIEQSRGEFEENRWPDAFQWIWISITCCKCGLESKDWVDYETA